MERGEVREGSNIAITIKVYTTKVDTAVQGRIKTTLGLMLPIFFSAFKTRACDVTVHPLLNTVGYINRRRQEFAINVNSKYQLL